MNTDIQSIAQQIVESARTRRIPARLIGGVAIAMHSPAASRAPLARSYEDIDIVIRKSDRTRIDGALEALGWEGDRRFNAINGAERRIYYHPTDPKVDVFVGSFNMCHQIEIGDDRLASDDPTVPLAELVLTKGQIVHLNQKDVTDLSALFLDHPLADNDGDAINARRIAAACANNWGLWRTITGTLDHLAVAVHDIGLELAQAQLVEQRVHELRAAIDDTKKSRSWKMRSRVGDRVKWYELPEEPHKTVTAN